MVAIISLLSESQSVMLALFVTVVFVSVASVKVKQSPAFSAMTIAMLGMMWRGEAWKMVCLQLEQQQLQQLQLRQPSASKTAFFGLYPSFRCGAVNLLHPVLGSHDLNALVSADLIQNRLLVNQYWPALPELLYVVHFPANYDSLGPAVCSSQKLIRTKSEKPQ
jgi:hypothetical protein